MLPPFVPPSARSASEHLPPITNYVVDATERSFEQSFALDSRVGETIAPVPLTVPSPMPSPLAEEGAGTRLMESALAWEEAEPADMTTAGLAEGRADEEPVSAPVMMTMVTGIEYSTTLPSIEEFVARKPYVERPGAVVASEISVSAEPQLVQLKHAPTRIEKETTTVSGTEADLEATVDTNVVEAITTAAPEETAPPVAVITSSIEETKSVEPPAVSGGDVSPVREWVEEERDSFDWQSVATLAAPANDDERAVQDWMSTDWDTPSTSQSENVAAILMQLARRVRSGELKIKAGRGMSTEAALAAVLTALLSEPDADVGSQNRE